MPSDIFRPQPQPQPNPPPATPPREAIPPQASSANKNEVASTDQIPTSVAILPADATPLAADSNGSSASAQILLDFDPTYLALAPGQQQTVLVRATSASGFPGGTITLAFDPAVAAVVVAKPILRSGSGVADANVEDNRVVIEVPSSPDLTGTRALAEITLRGIATGRASLTLAPSGMANAVVTTSQAVVDVR